jgi:hypothetical protein
MAHREMAEARSRSGAGMTDCDDPEGDGEYHTHGIACICFDDLDDDPYFGSDMEADWG